MPSGHLAISTTLTDVTLFWLRILQAKRSQKMKIYVIIRDRTVPHFATCMTDDLNGWISMYRMFC